MIRYQPLREAYVRRVAVAFLDRCTGCNAKIKKGDRYYHNFMVYRFGEGRDVRCPPCFGKLKYRL